MQKHLLIIWIAKLVSLVSRTINQGSGSTWPGHIALHLNQHFIQDVMNKYDGKVILVAGTNGKTTTAKMISSILGVEKVITNPSGANLLNGTTSALINSMDLFGNVLKKYMVLEVDEAILPLLLKRITPDIVICLNLFRDQLDRYGEVDMISEKWNTSLKNLPESSIALLNADDPQVAIIGTNLKAKVKYFGLEDKKLFKEMEHATDSTFCPKCGSRLIYEGVFFSHLGHWQCDNCGLKRPRPDINEFPSPLPGTYIKYDVLASALCAKILGLTESEIQSKLSSFQPAFGRQEDIIVNGKKVKIILSKNPTGFNQTIDTVLHMGDDKKNYVLALNDFEQDGKDISWIYDVDFEKLLPHIKNLIITGRRAEDMAVRVRYAGINEVTYMSDFKKALNEALNKMGKNDTLYVLPTYSAMLEIRKILLGRKLL